MSVINQHPSYLDRASHLRSDESALDELYSRAAIVEIRKGRLLCTPGALTFHRAPELSSVENPGQRYFLGIDHATSTPYFAWDSTLPISAQEESSFLNLREIGPMIDGVQLEIAGTAIALGNWHHSHPRCSRCGAPTRVSMGGMVRVCDVDDAQHHPRTDGAVIVLVKDREDRILLGHNPLWPDKRFSTFAGFLEPGETFEQCVAREVREESGVIVSEATYLGSQPWPFPASIMIAFEAVTDDPTAAKPDGAEITEVRWFSREELRKASESGEILLPPSISVARKMIQRWFNDSESPLRGGEAWR